MWFLGSCIIGQDRPWLIFLAHILLNLYLAIAFIRIPVATDHGRLVFEMCAYNRINFNRGVECLSYRVKRDTKILMLFLKSGQNVANRRSVVVASAQDQPHFRVGLSGKKLEMLWPENRIKRLIRHVWIKHQFPPATDDFVVIARKGGGIARLSSSREKSSYMS